MQLTLGCPQHPRRRGLLYESGAAAVESLEHLQIPRQLWPTGLLILAKQADAQAATDAQERQACKALAECMLPTVRVHMETWDFPTRSQDTVHPSSATNKLAGFSISATVVDPQHVTSAFSAPTSVAASSSTLGSSAAGSSGRAPGGAAGGSAGVWPIRVPCVHRAAIVACVPVWHCGG